MRPLFLAYDIVKEVENYYFKRLMITLVIMLIIMTICGFIARAIVKGKGYDNTVAWFFCGFFLCVIGIVIAAVQPEKTHSSYNYNQGYNQNTYGAPPPRTIICKSCGAMNSATSLHCQSCGTRLDPIKDTNNKDNKWKCKCGALNYAYETSCHRCGENKFQKKQSAPTQLSMQSFQEPQPQAAEDSAASVKQQLQQYKEMQEQGLITAEDFEAKKKQLLGI